MFHFSAFIALSSCIISVACLSNDITIECNGNPTWKNSEIEGLFVDLQEHSNVTVACSNVRTDITFIIFQVHTHRRNIVLYQDSIRPNTSFTGTNVGMYSKHDENARHDFSIANFNNVTVKAYISIHAYKNMTAPIPGGCNLVSPVDVDPTVKLLLQHNESLIQLSIDPARIVESMTCGLENKVIDVSIEYKFYRMYMKELNYDEMEYFDSLRKMLTVESIEENGAELAPMTLNIPDVLRFFSAYPGTGSVYAVIVVTSFGRAVYVPSYTYGCTLVEGQDSCPVFDDVLTQVIYAMIFFTGLFVCYKGHSFFKTEMFLMGLTVGSVVTYMIMSRFNYLESVQMSGAALSFGLFCGAIWLLVWWFYGMPFVSILLPVLILGALASSVVMFTIPDGFQILTFDTSYWCIFFTLLLCIPIFISLTNLHANILSCAAIGAFATVFPIDFYIGSNLKYMVINVIRRAVVPGFGKAYLATPFQWRDVTVLLVLILLSVTGFLLQHYHGLGRPPFPPPPRLAMSPGGSRGGWFVTAEGGAARTPPRQASERTPLLA